MVYVVGERNRDLFAIKGEATEQSPPGAVQQSSCCHPRHLPAPSAPQQPPLGSCGLPSLQLENPTQRMTALLKGREPPKTIAKLAELMSGSQGAEVYLQQLTTAALHRAGHVAAGTGWVLWGGAQLSGARSCGSVAGTGCKEALSPLKVTQLASRAASTISHLLVVSQPHASTPCVPFCQC